MTMPTGTKTVRCRNEQCVTYDQDQQIASRLMRCRECGTEFERKQPQEPIA